MAKKPFDQEEDEITLFREAMDQAARLHHDKTEPFRRRLRPFPLPPNPAATGETPEQELIDLPIETGDELEFRRPGVQNRLFQELRRGHLPPEEMLDLHGLRVAEARNLLARFLGHAHRHRLRVIQIVHGKGYGSESRQPVLKQKVNQWLRQLDQVLAFCSAPRFDGGTGAVYVLLSRKNRPHEGRLR